jgi:hypothetical protein
MSIDANQKCFQTCHLISRNGFIITKINNEHTDVLAMLTRYQNAAAAPREYAERFAKRHHPGARQ